MRNCHFPFYLHSAVLQLSPSAGPKRLLEHRISLQAARKGYYDLDELDRDGGSFAVYTSHACHVACTYCRTMTTTIKASVCLALVTQLAAIDSCFREHLS